MLLAAVLGNADALLRGRPQAHCLDSDGLVGYSFSHRGLWIPGYQLLGTAFTARQCSEACLERKDCVGFSGSFKEDGGNGACYVYAATGKNVPSSSDRAYRKCPGASATASPASPPMAAAVHLLANEQVSAGTASKVATEEELMTMAQGMEKQLDQISNAMIVADAKMRRLNSLVAGVANVLTYSSKVASATSEAALGNQVGLKAISNTRQIINMTFASVNTTGKQVDSILKRIEARAVKTAAAAAAAAAGIAAAPAGAAGTPRLADLAPNVTRIEDQMNKLNDPKTFKAVTDLVTNYTGLKNHITATVKGVVQTHIRGLVDTMRLALHNYTSAVGGEVKKGPCCVNCK